MGVKTGITLHEPSLQLPRRCLMVSQAESNHLSWFNIRQSQPFSELAQRLVPDAVDFELAGLEIANGLITRWITVC